MNRVTRKLRRARWAQRREGFRRWMRGVARGERAEPFAGAREAAQIARLRAQLSEVTAAAVLRLDLLRSVAECAGVSNASDLDEQPAAALVMARYHEQRVYLNLLLAELAKSHRALQYLQRSVGLEPQQGAVDPASVVRQVLARWPWRAQA